MYGMSIRCIWMCLIHSDWALTRQKESVTHTRWLVVNMKRFRRNWSPYSLTQLVIYTMGGIQHSTVRLRFKYVAKYVLLEVIRLRDGPASPKSRCELYFLKLWGKTPPNINMIKSYIYMQTYVTVTAHSIPCSQFPRSQVTGVRMLSVFPLPPMFIRTSHISDVLIISSPCMVLTPSRTSMSGWNSKSGVEFS